METIENVTAPIETNENKIILDIPNYTKDIAELLSLKEFQVKAVLEMLKEWDTVPFIARYRKEKTDWLDEVQIREIAENQKRMQNLLEAKQTAINGINSQWKLTPELMQNILLAKTLKEVEEIYKPYKSKKKTKAMIALEKGFWPIAEEIKKNIEKDEIVENKDFCSLLETYAQEEIIDWAICIVAAEITQNAKLRDFLRNHLQKNGYIVSKIKSQTMLDKLNEKNKEQVSKFDIYADCELLISKIKPYQVLAINRWENLEILNIKIARDEEILELFTKNIITNPTELYTQAIKDWYSALFESVENEIRWILSEIAEDESIKVFSTNLANLFLTKPEYGKKILAIDPGFRAGCKITILDELGNPILFDKIFLHEKNNAIVKLTNIFKNHAIDTVVVGNWTWSNETIELLVGNENIRPLPEIYIVNESWASVYSASEIAAEEFPDLDSLDRWTVSIWRRFIDPLSELVKVPVWSIWVWMYQHDIPEKKLEEKLGYVVEDSINQVWVNVNTASSYVLNHISWLNKRTSKKIYNNRPYKSREALAKKLTEKEFEQAAWFLRIPESKEKLDNTNIHPMQYELAKYIIENNITKLAWNESKLKEIYSESSQSTLDFIWESYNNIGKDIRVNSTHTKYEKLSLNFDDVKIGDKLNWVVRNVLSFWVFVDVWLKNDGLVHISQVADSFVKDPNDFVKVWEKVVARVVGKDEEKCKLQLSLRK